MSSVAVISEPPAVESPIHHDPLVPICEHIKDDGIRCGTPSIRGRHFCYYHSRAHQPRHRVGDPHYNSPIPESVQALQISVAHVLQALARGEIAPKVANSMFYGLHLATKALRMPKHVPGDQKQDFVREVTPAMEGVLAGNPIPEPADTDPAYIQQLADSLLTLNQIEENYVVLRQGEKHYDYYECQRRVAAHYAASNRLRDLGLLHKYQAPVR